MREKLFSIGDDYWIENEEGQRVFKVNGKALRMRDTFVLEGADGNELAKVQERKPAAARQDEVERDGDTVANDPEEDRCRRAALRIEIEGGGDGRRRATSSTTSTRSSARETRSRRCRRGGSAPAIPTA